MRRLRWPMLAVMLGGSMACTAEAQGPAPGATPGPVRVASAACAQAPAGESPRGGRPRSNPEGNAAARRSAQRALAFLGQEVSRWQEQNRCYGCHVQAVTLEALSVGRSNGYDVPERHMATVLEGMLTLPGGARAQGGLSYHVSSLLEPSNAFGGAAFAQYDDLVDGRVTDDLLAVAARLETFQQADGSIGGNYANGPVAQGTIQSTTQAVQTWRQAYARSADARWLRPIRRAEDFLAGTARTLVTNQGGATQHVNYTILGLLAAGARETEETLQRLAVALRERQQPDGSWSGSALETGQALYALRRMGASDDDAAVRKGTTWLIEQQQGDGGWGLGGASRGTAMWAVLGLVSIDVASLEITGVSDGQHLATAANLTGVAVDNEQRRIAKSELFIDDVRVASACGDRVSFRVDPATLGAGRHIVRMSATNAAGRTSEKRIELYTGDFFLTEAGSRWVDGATVLSVRDVAPASLSHRVVLEVYAVREQDGRQVRDRRVHRAERPGAQGGVEMRWDGSARGRYVAELAFVDAQGRTRHRVEVPFVHDSPEARHAAFGEVAGSLTLAEGGVAQNAEVELVDAQGNVVARTRSTSAGRYRFQDVQQGRYQVRVRGPRGAARAAPVTAAPASEAAADMLLQ